MLLERIFVSVIALHRVFCIFINHFLFTFFSIISELSQRLRMTVGVLGDRLKSITF